MSSISAAEVKALRTQTGAGMMDCKRALSDAGGDSERAMELLRERGLAKAGKRAGRATSEGAIGVSLNSTVGAIVELGCETDFVARTEEYQALVQQIADLVASNADLTDAEKTLSATMGEGSVEVRIQAAIAQLGENVELKRVARVVVDSGLVGGYVHAGGKLGVIVGIAADVQDERLEGLAKDVAMHVAAAKTQSEFETAKILEAVLGIADRVDGAREIAEDLGAQRVGMRMGSLGFKKSTSHGLRKSWVVDRHNLDRMANRLGVELSEAKEGEVGSPKPPQRYPGHLRAPRSTPYGRAWPAGASSSPRGSPPRR